MKAIDLSLAEELAQLQSYGANRGPSIWRHGDLTFIHSRFDVTSDAFPDTVFPLSDERYVVHYNGEVFGFRKERYIDTSEPSDVHYCLSLIRTHGIEEVLRHADLQGTFQIHDFQTGQTWIFVDQINSGGAFYALWDDKIIAAQELALVDHLLSLMNIPENVAIRTIANGSALVIDRCGSVEIVELRPQARMVYGRTNQPLSGLERAVVSLQSALEEAVIRRIPKQGPVAVLASGGVDSSVILAITKKHLEKKGMLDRLKVVTFGRQDAVANELNDLYHSLLLLDSLGLPRDQHLLLIQQDEFLQKKLLMDKVFCDHPRLITPNPVLGSQIRHTVRMSLVLANLVNRYPEIKVVLTGDVADELFAGYPSMRQGVDSAVALRERIREKLTDLPLNDAARYTLASLHGCRAVLHYMNEEGGAGRDHPIEIRTPFSSHEVLEVAGKMNPDHLIGILGTARQSKFPLRLVALRLGIPFSIATRLKVPFNHGGSGLSNDSRDPIELHTAEHWKPLSEANLRLILRQEGTTLDQIGLTQGKVAGEGDSAVRVEQLIAYLAAEKAGLKRLVKGGAFRRQMPDTVYATLLNDSLYIPEGIVGFDTERNSLYVSDSTN